MYAELEPQRGSQRLLGNAQNLLSSNIEEQVRSKMLLTFIHRYKFVRYSPGQQSTTLNMTENMAQVGDTANNGCTDNAWSHCQDRESNSAFALNGLTTLKSPKRRIQFRFSLLLLFRDGLAEVSLVAICNRKNLIPRSALGLALTHYVMRATHHVDSNLLLTS